jgi:outer membrane biosynthesis protein TonB
MTARFSVTAAGHVEDVRLSAPASQEIEASLRDAIGGWLFLPQIKAGSPVACRVEVPLRF